MPEIGWWETKTIAVRIQTTADYVARIWPYMGTDWRSDTLGINAAGLITASI